MGKKLNTNDVLRKLSAVLQEKNLRKSVARYAILSAICKQKKAFDAYTIYDFLSLCNYRISLATVYNSLQFFAEENLIILDKKDGRTTFYKNILIK
jgi:Fur family ferric uptake transcriptional regulator